MTEDATTLYRVFTSGGTLLYVGISKSMLTRLEAHARTSKWFGHGGNITMEHWPSRDEALQAEAAAIASERPAFNVQILAGHGDDWERNESQHRCWSLYKSRAADGDVVRCASWKGHYPSPFQALHQDDVYGVSWNDEQAWNFDEQLAPPTPEELLAKERWERYDRIKNRRVVVTFPCAQCGAPIGEWCLNTGENLHWERDPTWDRWMPRTAAELAR